MKRILSRHSYSASMKSYVCAPGMPKIVSTPLRIRDLALAWPWLSLSALLIPEFSRGAEVPRGRDAAFASIWRHRNRAGAFSQANRAGVPGAEWRGGVRGD